MSTRTRESAPPGKEKRGTSPSPIGTGGATLTQRRRSPVPSKTNSPAQIPDSTTSGRSIPSYLKPTASSANDVSKVKGQKPLFSTTDSANKPALARRRSFDKPPSPSRTQKSPVSPSPALRSSSFSGKTGTDSCANKPALARRRSLDKPPSPSRSTKSPASLSPTLRSSSFSGKIGTSSQKGVSERNLKGPKDVGKQHTLYARPVSTVTKSGVLAKKKEPVSGSSRKERAPSPPEKVEVPYVNDVPELEPQSDDQESVIAEEEKILIGNCNEKESEDSVLQDQDLMNITEQTEGESDGKDAEIVTIESPAILELHDANIVMVESPIVLESQDDKIVTIEPSTDFENEEASVGVEKEELEEESRVEEISNQQEEIEEHNTDEMNNIDIDESVAGNPNEEAENKEREEEDKEQEDEEEEGKEEEEEEAIALNKKEDVDSGSEYDEIKEKEMQEAVAAEKSESENSTPGVAHGKKDLALSNDVIEETASKLIEQRQNRVKALAGAFETVISSQDPK